jgi:hypothetical protein
MQSSEISCLGQESNLDSPIVHQRLVGMLKTVADNEMILEFRRLALVTEEVGSVCTLSDFFSRVAGSTGNPDSLFVILFCPSRGNSGIKATGRGGP